MCALKEPLVSLPEMYNANYILPFGSNSEGRVALEDKEQARVHILTIRYEYAKYETCFITGTQDRASTVSKGYGSRDLQELRSQRCSR